MKDLKSIVLNGKGKSRGGGRLVEVDDMRQRYIADLTSRTRLARPLKTVVACGNGTASIFAPEVLRAIGCEVVPLHCELDFAFPNYNPNPEDLLMLDAVSRAVLSEEADIGFAFDGDGDRCGVVDNEGKPIFADKVGVLLARAISEQYPRARFVVDVKSTGLFHSDPVLQANGALTEYYKTGHSYMKRRIAEVGAIAGFERSGHFFFNKPLGRGYDDGLVTAISICALLNRSRKKSMADLYNDLPVTWSSPTMSPYCSDETKYRVVAQATAYLEELNATNKSFAGQMIANLTLTNGVRVTLEDGTWGLVRASSNKPELVIVCESPTSEASMHQIFVELERLLAGFPEIGEYNQKLETNISKQK
jgi:phosphomannomutase/phosphoglucomutase